MIEPLAGLRRKVDALTVMAAFLLENHQQADWLEVATGALHALLGDLQQQATLLDTFLVENF